eukprot:scaffold31864_cov18-Tisochrysis_lutea.AAC.1
MVHTQALRMIAGHCSSIAKGFECTRVDCFCWSSHITSVPAFIPTQAEAQYWGEKAGAEALYQSEEAEVAEAAQQSADAVGAEQSTSSGQADGNVKFAEQVRYSRVSRGVGL